MTLKCGYCLKDKTKPGWHDCPQAVAGRKQLGNVLVGIHELMVGGQEKWEAPEAEARSKFMKQHFDKLGD